MSPSGIAPRLTATKGALKRGLNSWTIRASPSLPVPVSPRMRTVVVGRRREPHPLDHLAHPGLSATYRESRLICRISSLRRAFSFPRSRFSRCTSSTMRLLWSAIATRCATCRATSKQHARSPSARRVGDVERPEQLVLEDERERHEGAVAVGGEERLLAVARLAGMQGVEDAGVPGREGLARRGPREREGRADVRRRLAGVGDEDHLRPGRVDRRDPVDGDARLAEVPPEELAGPVEDRGEIDGREDELDRLLDDPAVRIVLALGQDRESERGGAVGNHAPVSTEMAVPAATDPWVPIASTIRNPS